jgi:hypothetical protein
MIVTYKFSNFNLAPGKYTIRGRIEVNSIESDWPEDILGYFDVEMGDFYQQDI